MGAFVVLQFFLVCSVAISLEVAVPYGIVIPHTCASFGPRLNETGLFVCIWTHYQVSVGSSRLPNPFPVAETRAIQSTIRLYSLRSRT